MNSGSPTSVKAIGLKCEAVKERAASESICHSFLFREPLLYTLIEVRIRHTLNEGGRMGNW